VLKLGAYKRINAFEVGSPAFAASYLFATPILEFTRTFTTIMRGMATPRLASHAGLFHFLPTSFSLSRIHPNRE